MVGLSGFEPLTSRLSAVRSSQLSYRPVVATDSGRLACPRRGCFSGSQRAIGRANAAGWLPEN